LRIPLGSVPITGKLRQQLDAMNGGRDVIVGIRPENFEDAALVQPDNRSRGVTFHATIDVRESMGSDVFVYFTQDLAQGVKGVDAAELQELAKDSGRAETGATGDTVVARLDAATRISEGENAELWADLRAMHVFDPASGRNLSVEGGEAPAPAAPPATTATEAVPDQEGSDPAVT
jgi:multiple sugar transport system ATP-binding protein